MFMICPVWIPSNICSRFSPSRPSKNAGSTQIKIEVWIYKGSNYYNNMQNIYSYKKPRDPKIPSNICSCFVRIKSSKNTASTSKVEGWNTNLVRAWITAWKKIWIRPLPEKNHPAPAPLQSRKIPTPPSGSWPANKNQTSIHKFARYSMNQLAKNRAKTRIRNPDENKRGWDLLVGKKSKRKA